MDWDSSCPEPPERWEVTWVGTDPSDEWTEVYKRKVFTDEGEAEEYAAALERDFVEVLAVRRVLV